MGFATCVGGLPVEDAIKIFKFIQQMKWQIIFLCNYARHRLFD